MQAMQANAATSVSPKRSKFDYYALEKTSSTHRMMFYMVFVTRYTIYNC